jgi:CoA:oxalate CoA-transferase
MEECNKTGALGGLKVLDFTRVFAGPYCTMMLADLGADVIKIERPGSGDDSRNFMPLKNKESGYFIYLNRNKKSITIDLQTEEGKSIALKLARHVDVVVENFSPGTMKKLGLGYADIRKVNPEIVYASISGFGQTGPLSKKVAYDPVAQAMGGLMGVTGYPDRPPVKVGSSIADANAGIHCAFAIMAAMYYKQQTGKGQYIDISLLDTVFSILENHVVQYTMLGNISQRLGNGSMTSYPFDTFKTKDDYVVIASSNDKIFCRLAHAMKLDELVTDIRFKTNEARVAHETELKTIIEKWSGQYLTSEIVELLDREKVPVAPILTMKEVIEQPQIRERDMLVEIDHPVAGRFCIPNTPIKLSVTPGGIRTTAPLLGQDTETVLKEILGLTSSEVDSLKRMHVI